ncbi:helix-turn-helix domain-containing protein [Nonomuraea terrae]|uniref:helix-turn-helix domain-containing protein n=1 Tax=Nonomuraea terrae TaxID=2530383 RepID=UPI003788E7E2
MTSPDTLPELAHFLRSRRARLSPESVGLPRTQTRRLPGLRRAEVAALAGISPEYYTRLEQGRQRRPSAEVVAALAGALRLDADGRRHLHRLTTYPVRPAIPSDNPGTALVPDATRRLLRSMTTWPAYVVSPMRDVLAWNEAAAWLLTGFAALPEHQRNLAWFAFCAPEAQELYADWAGVARGNVHRLRDALAADPHNARGNRLVTELSAHSARFAESWEEHDVRGPNIGGKKLTHPQAGALTLDYAGYVLPGPHRLELVVMTAEENSPTHQALVHASESRT